MIFTRSTVCRVAAMAYQFTDGVVELKNAYNPGDGLRYVDAKKDTRVWRTDRSRTAAQEAAAFYAGAAYQWGVLNRIPEEYASRDLREAQSYLSASHRPLAVRASWADGVEVAGLAWMNTAHARGIISRRAQANPGTSQQGDRRTLTLSNRKDLAAWSGGREPADPGSDVLLIDQIDGTVMCVVLGQTVERATGGYRKVPRADLIAEAEALASSLAGQPLAYAYGDGVYHPARQCVLPAVLAHVEGMTVQQGLTVFPEDTTTALAEIAVVMGVTATDEVGRDRFPVPLRLVADLFWTVAVRPLFCGTCGDTVTRLPLIPSD